MATPSITADELLIIEVQKYEFLYNAKHPNHKNKLMRSNAWDAISKIVGNSAVDCEKRFRSLRDRYRKNRPKDLPSGSGSSQKKKPWALLDALSFLENHVIEKSAFSWTNALTVSDETTNIDDPDKTLEVAVAVDTDSQVWLSSFNRESDFLGLTIPSSARAPSSIDVSRDNNIASTITTVPGIVNFMASTSSNLNSSGIINRHASSSSSDGCRDNNNTGSSPITINPSGGRKRKSESIENVFNKILAEPEMTEVDHLMSYIGGMIKKYPEEKQSEACEELMEAFFAIHNQFKLNYD